MEPHNQYRDRLLDRMTGLVKDRQAAEEITATAFAKPLAAARPLLGFDIRRQVYTLLSRINVVLPSDIV